MDGVRTIDMRKTAALSLSATVAVALTVLQQTGVLSLDSISLMSSDTGDTTGTTTTTGSEACTAPVFASEAPQDYPLPSDATLNFNAQARIVSDQEAIQVLKRQLALARTCADRTLLEGHIQMHRDSIDQMRSGVVPIRPPYNYD